MGVSAAVLLIGALLAGSSLLAAGAQRLVSLPGARGSAARIRMRRPPPHPPVDRWLYEAEHEKRPDADRRDFDHRARSPSARAPAAITATTAAGVVW